MNRTRLTPHLSLYTDPADCQWLRETVLRGYEDTIPPFRSFTLLGNEDCPLEITFYADSGQRSLIPSITWELADAGLHNNLSCYVPR